LKDLKTQFVSALLFVLTVAAVSCAIINFRQHRTYRLPDDGVTWGLEYMWGVLDSRDTFKATPVESLMRFRCLPPHMRPRWGTRIELVLRNRGVGRLGLRPRWRGERTPELPLISEVLMSHCLT